LGVDTPGLAKGNLPTALGSIAILDKAGALLKSWEGFLSAAQQEEVLGFVQRSLK
jgi:predicted transcriptional regulator